MFEESKVGTKIVGFYRGQVMKHCEKGNCKIFWPGVNPMEWKLPENIEKLPEAEQAAPLFGAALKRDGVYFYPDIGSIVWGFFENGDPNHPIYFASTLNFDANASSYNTDCKGKIEQSSKEFANNESRRTAIINLGDLKVKINAQEKALEITDTSTDSKISFTDEGISLTSPKTIKLSATSVEIKSLLNTDIKSNVLVTVQAGGTNTIGAVSIFGNRTSMSSKGGGSYIGGQQDNKTYW